MDSQDKAKPLAGDWSWVPRALPGVAKLMREQRAAMGNAWVNECMRRGLTGEAGWFFAREGAVAIGTPWPTTEVSLQLAMGMDANLPAGAWARPFLCLRVKGPADA